MRRFDQPMVSRPRISRSRGVRVRTRSSTPGSRSSRGSVAATTACSPAASWRRAVATCRLDWSLPGTDRRRRSAPPRSCLGGRHPIAPAAWSSARPPLLPPTSRPGRWWAGQRPAPARLAGARRPTRPPGRCGGPGRGGQVVLGIKEHSKPLGDHHMVIGEHEHHSVGNDVSQSFC
jgi:hypothetical protein